jgi:hypothetical protein
VRRLEGVECPARAHALALARPRLNGDLIHAWLAGLGVEPTAPLETVHERPWSTVLRVPTADGDLYLKQEAPVQAYEVPLTAALASRWPDRVPGVVGVDVERAWLLMRDGGIPLADAGTFEPFPLALRLYGELQVAEVEHVADFLAIGLPDARLPVVAAAYEPFLEEDHGLTAEELARLRAFAPRYYELCEELASFGLPDSIQHDDLHEWNVFVRDGHVAIFDWGDSGVSHPLLSWLKPLGVTIHRRLDPEPLLAAYLSHWTQVMAEERLRAAIEVAVPVGSFAYALAEQRKCDAMPPDGQAHFLETIPQELRTFLARMDAA